ncbi:single-stranded DNA-binding protein [Prevotella sp.]|uniref:single-stranded DNA-binding protein n=1 Tax=Prevotella sp. TaxID=59823 RepID=UPI0027E354E5|nr:single-stranded DNA-binding protein [Prevotella sp.]
MKKIENNFTVTGFVGNNAEIRQFTTASVARFSLAVSRQEKNGEETNHVSAFISMEAWRKNEHIESFDQLTKGTLLTAEGYFKPDEWIDQQGTKHNRIVFIANKFYPALEKEEPGAESTEQPTTKTKKK